MPSHICHAGSRGRARTGHSSLLATPVYTWKGKKMEHSWTINKPTTVQLCSVCIMSAWFFSFILFYLALVNWLIFWNVKMKAPSNLFSSTNLAGIMFQSGPELSLKSFGTSLAGLPFNLSLRSHINLWTNVAKSRRVGTRPSFRERNQGRFGYLHLPGFSQNPFSMLHSELHSQPLRQKESDKSAFAFKIHQEKKRHKSIWNVQSYEILIWYTFLNTQRVTEEKTCGSQISLSDDPRGLVKWSNYLWRCLSRSELRPQLWDAS